MIFSRRVKVCASLCECGGYTCWPVHSRDFPKPGKSVCRETSPPSARPCYATPSNFLLAFDSTRRGAVDLPSTKYNRCPGNCFFLNGREKFSPSPNIERRNQTIKDNRKICEVMPVGDWNFLSCAQKISINELIWINEINLRLRQTRLRHTNYYPFVHRS